MSAQEFLRGWQPESCPVLATGYQRIEDRVLQLVRNAWPVVLDLDSGNNRVSLQADRVVVGCPCAHNDVAVTTERCNGVTNDIQDGLHDLVAVEKQVRKTRVVLPVEREVLRGFRLDNADDVFVSLAELSFEVVDYQGDLMNYSVSTFPDIGSDSDSNVGDGKEGPGVGECWWQFLWVIHPLRCRLPSR